MSLDVLFQRAQLWRGGETPPAVRPGIPTGFAALDELLPGSGWPRGALSEILAAEGHGALSLLMPALARLHEDDRWIAFVAPPYLPYPPALAARGINLARVLCVSLGNDAIESPIVSSLRRHTRAAGSVKMRPLCHSERSEESWSSLKSVNYKIPRRLRPRNDKSQGLSHSLAGGHPVEDHFHWIPASAGMTKQQTMMRGQESSKSMQKPGSRFRGNDRDGFHQNVIKQHLQKSVRAEPVEVRTDAPFMESADWPLPFDKLRANGQYNLSLSDQLWVLAQCLRSHACAAVLSWFAQPPVQHLRRLQLAAEAGGALACLFYPLATTAHNTPAALRLAISPHTSGVSVRILKRRGGWPCGPVYISAT